MNYHVSQFHKNVKTMFARNYYIVFKRIDNDQVIPPSALQSIDEGATLITIKNNETIGQKPSQFASDRSFWVPTQISDINNPRCNHCQSTHDPESNCIFYNNITDYMENEFPEYCKSGEWGCCALTEEPLKDLQESKPDGFLIETINRGKFWVWLKE